MLGKNLVATMIMLATAGAALADAKEDVLAAARKLADSENYSWTATTEGAGNVSGGGSEGKTEKDGLTLLVLNLRVGSAKVIFKGDKGAVETPDEGWQSIPSATDDASGRGVLPMVANMIKTYQPPAVQAMNLVAKLQDLQKTGDGFAGTLSADEAKSLLQRRVGRRQNADGAGGGPEFKDARGTVRFWTTNDVLTKFQFNLQGTMTLNGESREIDRTTTVEIKDIGTTKIEVPEEARGKMG